MALTAEQIKAFDPKNAKNLTEEQINFLRTINDDELKQLADAYPNQSTGTTYLLLADKNQKDNKQLYQRSTYNNLYNLRVKNGLQQFSIHTFNALYKPEPTASTNTGFQRAPAQDLSKKEIEAAPGLKKAEPQSLAPVPTLDPVPELEPVKEIEAAPGQTDSEAASEEENDPENDDDEFPEENFADELEQFNQEAADQAPTSAGKKKGKKNPNTNS